VSAVDYQLVDVFLLVGNVAPIALYFLVLGLVNTHSRPCLMTSRADFIVLSSVLAPLLVWPLSGLVQTAAWWLLVPPAVLLAAIFFSALPRSAAGFVIYNISEARAAHLVAGALRSMVPSGAWDGKDWYRDDGQIILRLRSFPLLRNVTLHIEARDRATADRFAREFGTLVEQRLSSIAQLPSTTGAGLVLLGLALMGLPMWMVSRHIDDIVDAMSHLFG